MREKQWAQAQTSDANRDCDDAAVDVSAPAGDAARGTDAAAPTRLPPKHTYQTHTTNAGLFMRRFTTRI